jgi:uncharacterized protein (TIGR03437 family)
MLALAAVALAVPLHFEPNQGLSNPEVRYTAVTNGYTLELSDTVIAMNFRGGSVRMKLPRTKPEGADELEAKSNYYLGSNPSKWRTGIPNFARVRYGNVFRGVDLAVYGNGQRIEYDWIVAPGADPRSIRFSFTGVSKMRVDHDGDLILETSGGEVRHTRPRITQSGREIDGRFVLKGDEVRFEVGAYDRARPLIIDPVLVVNTSFGGSGVQLNSGLGHLNLLDLGTGIATDSSGNIYVTGTTFSANFPLVSPLQVGPQCLGCKFSSVFVTKLSPDGGTLIYSSYIGPPSTGQGYGNLPLLPAAIAVDAGGTAYVTGTTLGANFPGVTTAAGANDAFLLRLNPQGALIGTQLFGGSADDAGTSIVLGPEGYIYLAGTTKSSDFPVTQNAYRGISPDPNSVFLVKISFTSAFGTTKGVVIYSTYVGPGTSASVAADAGGNAYIAAATTSAGWPTTAGAAQPKCAGANCGDIAIAKLDATGQKLLYATYLGGSQAETLGGIAVDVAGSAYVAGGTNSADFPVTPGALQTHSMVSFPAANYTGFVAKLSADATKFVYATYLGGSTNDQAIAIAVDAGGNAYVGGATTSPDFPLRQAIQSTPVNGICDSYTPSGTIPDSQYDCASGGFLSVLNPSGTALAWSTYLGAGSVNAVALDSTGNVSATGLNIAVNGPAMSGSVGVLKIAPGASPLDVPANAIVNAASYAPGLPLPGGLASVFLRGLNISSTMLGTGSPLPTKLAGLSIRVDGVPAPILAVAPLASGMQQINFQVPFESTTNNVEIRYQGSSTFASPQTAGPGIFIMSDGTPAIQHSADYSLVTPSNPARPGETILVYATGLGRVSPLVASGVAASGATPVAAPPCSVGAIYAVPSMPENAFGSISYAGLTPGFVGLYQLNIQLAKTLQAGTVQFSIKDLLCDLFQPADLLQSNTVNLPVQ